MPRYRFLVAEARIVECEYIVEADSPEVAREAAEIGDTVSETDLKDQGVNHRTILEDRGETPAPAFTPEQVAAYLKDPDSCPFCGHKDMEGTGVQQDGENEIQCPHCGALWAEEIGAKTGRDDYDYEVTGVRLIEPPTRPILPQPLIAVHWDRHGEPHVILPPGLDAVVQLIDSDVEGSLILTHHGVSIYQAIKDDIGDCYQFSDYWVAAVPLADHESDHAFDLRDLKGIPEEQAEKYEALFPEDSNQQALAYAIDQGLIDEDGYHG